MVKPNRKNNKKAIYEFLLANGWRSYTNQKIALELDVEPSWALYALRALVRDELVLFDSSTKNYRISIATTVIAW